MVKQGDVIKTNFDPAKGHEQSGYRPALVISPALFTHVTNLVLVCPITNTNRNHPLHIELKGLQTTGFVMTEQIRVVDLRERQFRVIERVQKGVFVRISNIIKASVDLSDDFE